MALRASVQHQPPLVGIVAATDEFLHRVQLVLANPNIQLVEALLALLPVEYPPTIPVLCDDLLQWS